MKVSRQQKISAVENIRHLVKDDNTDLDLFGLIIPPFTYPIDVSIKPGCVFGESMLFFYNGNHIPRSTKQEYRKYVIEFMAAVSNKPYISYMTSPKPTKKKIENDMWILVC